MEGSNVVHTDSIVWIFARDIKEAVFADSQGHSSFLRLLEYFARAEITLVTLEVFQSGFDTF